MDKQEILERIKLMPRGEKTDDKLLELYYDIVEQKILNSINKTIMPKELIFSVLIPMLLDTIDEYDEEVDQEISSISEEGRTVSFKGDFASRQMAILNNRLKEYEEQLSTFRRITW